MAVLSLVVLSLVVEQEGLHPLIGLGPITDLQGLRCHQVTGMQPQLFSQSVVQPL